MLKGLFQERENISRNTAPDNFIVYIYINTYGIRLSQASQGYTQG